MLNPSVIDLLQGVATALSNDVSDALPAGPARDQLHAAIAIIRRVARALPSLTPYLVADIADLAATLDALRAGQPNDDTLVLPDAGIAPLDALIRFDLELRSRLAEIADDNELDQEGNRLLRAALGRLADREAALRLSPWGR